MSVALLVGMKYKREERELPGIVLDLYRFYQWARQWAQEIYILTDITEDESIKTLRNHIFEGQVNPDIIYFIREIKQRNEYISYINRYTFLETLQNMCHSDGSRSDQIFFYYTGHGEQGDLILPNNETLTCRDLQLFALSNLPPTGQMLTILDCCNASTLGLPYKLHQNVYRLTPRLGRIYPQPEIICITSTTPHQNSITSSRGSVFSIALITELQKGVRDLRSLSRTINDPESQTMEFINWDPSMLPTPTPNIPYKKYHIDLAKIYALHSNRKNNRTSYSTLTKTSDEIDTLEDINHPGGHQTLSIYDSLAVTTEPHMILSKNTYYVNRSNVNRRPMIKGPMIKGPMIKGPTDGHSTKYMQTAMIYASKPDLIRLPGWLFNKVTARITYQTHICCLIIEREKQKKSVSSEVIGICLAK